MPKFGIISLGCPRNMVDSEVIVGSLIEMGFEISDIGEGVDICIVNTCAFIQSAREESIDTILEIAQLKKEGRIRRIVVCGCLAQLYGEELLKEMPQIDAVIGTNDFFKIKDLAKAVRKEKPAVKVTGALSHLYDENSPRFLLTPAHYVYVKISEGCSNFCSYCIISRLRGAFRSRSIESVASEVERLSKSGLLREINLIGQDTTLFGIDRYGKAVLPRLLKRLCGLENSVGWIRILYTHPAHYTDGLISTIRDERKICRYLDLPVQHIADKVLKRMNRHTTKKEIIGLIAKLRNRIPGITLRTSIIVGFPGESDKDFEELLNFLRETRFERLGAFLYSEEAATPASRFKGRVPERIKQERFDRVMKLQQDISAEVNKTFLGKTVEVLIDEKIDGEKDRFLCRTQADAPEVDGTVYVTGRNLEVGEFYDVRISDTLEYDLVGEAL